MSEDQPIVAVLGQSAGWGLASEDTTLQSALTKLNIIFSICQTNTFARHTAMLRHSDPPPAAVGG